MKNIFLVYIILFLVSFNLQIRGNADDNIKIVRNPQKPIYGNIVLKLSQNLKISFGKNVDDIFLDIQKIDIDYLHNIYILDYKKCVIFKFDKNGKYLNQFGKKGEGPGEFLRPRDFIIHKNGNIYILDGTRILKFNLKGEYIKDIIRGKRYFDYFFITSDESIIVFYSTVINNKREYVISCYNDNGSQDILKTFYIEKHVATMINKKKISFYLSHKFKPLLIFENTINGKCIFGFNMNYEMTLINEKGKQVVQIIKDQDKVPISIKEKKKVFNRIFAKLGKRWPKKMLREALQYPNHKPFFKTILSDGSGNIFVEILGSFEKKNKNIKDRYYDFFNKEGLYQYRIKMPLEPFFIRNGFIYTVEENEEDITELKRYTINNWPDLKVEK